MEYQKIGNLLDKEIALNALNHPPKLRIRNWVEINDKSEEHVLVMMLHLRLQSLIHVIMLMHTHLLRE